MVSVGKKLMLLLLVVGEHRITELVGEGAHAIHNWQFSQEVTRSIRSYDYSQE